MDASVWSTALLISTSAAVFSVASLNYRKTLFQLPEPSRDVRETWYEGRDDGIGIALNAVERRLQRRPVAAHWHADPAVVFGLRQRRQ